MTYKILRLPEVKNRTGLAKSTIYKKIVAKSFPAAITLGEKSVGWLESDINSWIESRIKQSANDNITQSIQSESANDNDTLDLIIDKRIWTERNGSYD